MLGIPGTGHIVELFLVSVDVSELCLFVCFDHRLFTPASTPKRVDFCVHGCLYSRLKGSRADFGEVHAGYECVAGTDIIAWTSVSGSFKSEYDHVHVHSN